MGCLHTTLRRPLLFSTRRTCRLPLTRAVDGRDFFILFLFLTFFYFSLVSGWPVFGLAISREKMRRLVHDNYRILFFCIGISFQYIAAGPQNTLSPLRSDPLAVIPSFSEAPAPPKHHRSLKRKAGRKLGRELCGLK